VEKAETRVNWMLISPLTERCATPGASASRIG
jgi:hypothetical protein